MVVGKNSEDIRHSKLNLFASFITTSIFIGGLGYSWYLRREDRRYYDVFMDDVKSDLETGKCYAYAKEYVVNYNEKKPNIVEKKMCEEFERYLKKQSLSIDEKKKLKENQESLWKSCKATNIETLKGNVARIQNKDEILLNHLSYLDAEIVTNKVVRTRNFFMFSHKPRLEDRNHSKGKEAANDRLDSRFSVLLNLADSAVHGTDEVLLTEILSLPHEEFGAFKVKIIRDLIRRLVEYDYAQQKVMVSKAEAYQELLQIIPEAEKSKLTTVAPSRRDIIPILVALQAQKMPPQENFAQQVQKISEEAQKISEQAGKISKDAIDISNRKRQKNTRAVEQLAEEAKNISRQAMDISEAAQTISIESQKSLTEIASRVETATKQFYPNNIKATVVAKPTDPLTPNEKKLKKEIWKSYKRVVDTFIYDLILRHDGTKHDILRQSLLKYRETTRRLTYSYIAKTDTGVSGFIRWFAYRWKYDSVFNLISSWK